MRITILTAGSRGDTQPYVALGVGLKQAGHAVRLAASEGFEELVTSNGLEYAPMEGNFRTILAGEAGQMRRGRVSLPWLALTLRRMVGPILEQMGHNMLAACRDAEVIVSALPFLSGDVAEHLGARYIPASLFPFARTREFAHPFLPPTIPRPLNRLSFTLAAQTAWQMFRPTINRFRRDVLSLKPWGLRGPYEAEHAAGLPTLYAFSRHVIPPPQDWPDNIHVTGYWWLDSPDWQPPADLVRFIESGPPPVFIGFGSMPDDAPAITTRLILDAVALAGCRAVLHSGWGGIGDMDLPDSVFRIDFAPYEWLFPRMAAVVHHGGAGTTGSALRAGAPNIVVAFLGDQTFWGKRVHDLGAGPYPIPRSRLTPERLAGVIRAMTSDPAMRARAAEIGTQIRAEDGVANAVRIIEQYLAAARA